MFQRITSIGDWFTFIKCQSCDSGDEAFVAQRIVNPICLCIYFIFFLLSFCLFFFHYMLYGYFVWLSLIEREKKKKTRRKKVKRMAPSFLSRFYWMIVAFCKYIIHTVHRDTHANLLFMNIEQRFNHFMFLIL